MERAALQRDGAPRGARIQPMQFFKDLSLSAMIVGFVVVLVGFISSVAIVF